MMHLNLTSPDTQQSLRRYAVLGAVRTIAVTCIILVALFLVVTFIGAVSLGSRAAAVTNDADQSTLLLRSQQQTTLADTTKRLNAQIRVLKGVQERYVAWLPIVSRFSELTPAGISLTSITFSQTPAQVNFVGTASSRDAYVAYEQVLNSSALLKNVTFPLQTKKTDITFNITADLVLP